MQKKGITFKSSTPYTQEQNRVSNQMGRTIIDMTKATILKNNINYKICPKLILAITYVRNNQPTKVLQNLSFHKILLSEPLNLPHLQILGSIVYVL